MKCKICDKQYNDYPPSGPWRRGGLCKECKVNIHGGKFSSKQSGAGRE